MKWVSIVLYIIDLVAAVLFVSAALDGHSDIYAPAAILLAVATVTAQRRRKARDRR